MENKPTPFFRHGTKDNKIEVSSDEILNAIEEGRDIDVEYATIKCGVYVKRPFLPRRFSIEREFQSDLVDGRTISEKLCSKLKENGITIERDAKILVVEKDRKWRIIYADTDRDWIYYVRKADNELDIYLNFAVQGSLNIKWSVVHRGIEFPVPIAGRVDFEGTTFYGYVSFYEAWFRNGVNFFEARFKNRASFKSAIFEETADQQLNFGGAHFFDVADFTDAKFLSSIVPDDANFIGTKFDAIPTFSSKEQLTPESFRKIALACRKSGLFGIGYLFDWTGEGYSNKKEYLKASDSYRNAKLECDKEGKYDDAGRMYVMEKESTRQYLKMIQKDKCIKSAEYYWLCILNKTCEYGESPIKFPKYVLIIISLFAIISIINYTPIGNWLPPWLFPTFNEGTFHQWCDGTFFGTVKLAVSNIVTAFYFSIVTFATLGFGDITPVNSSGRICAILEVAFGYLTLGILITLLARKMTRS